MTDAELMAHQETEQKNTIDEIGAEATIAHMQEWSRLEIGRKTYNFARRLMRDPELRTIIKARAAEIRAAEGIA